MKKILFFATVSLITTVVSAQSTIKGDVNGDGSVDVSDITAVASIILHGEQISPILGKWKDDDGNYYEFVSNDRGFFCSSNHGGMCEAFIYKFNKSTGKITFLYGDEYEAIIFHDNRIVDDGTVYVKVSAGSDSYPKNTVIGVWNASSGNTLTFNNYNQGEYSPAEGDESHFTYIFDESTGVISLSFYDTNSAAIVNGSSIVYNGENYSIGYISQDDAIYGQWRNGKSRIYFKSETYGYYEGMDGKTKDFNFTFNSTTGKITLYFYDKTRETAELIIDSDEMYILYNSTKFYL